MTCPGEIDWTAPRLLCIAGGFTRYDEHAVQQMNRNIELIRYRRFGENLLMLELVTEIVAKQGTSSGSATETTSSNQKTISGNIDGVGRPLQDLFQALRAHLMALGDDVQEKTLKFYVAFKRLRNFACVEVHPSKAAVTVYLKVDPSTIKPEQEDFSRDVRNIGHYGTGDLELTLSTLEDLETGKASTADELRGKLTGHVAQRQGFPTMGHAVSCSLIHSRSASSIRVCHPWPATANGGLGELLRPVVPERSGASSRSKPRCVECFFPFMGFPDADHTMRVAARRPDVDRHPALGPFGSGGFKVEDGNVHRAARAIIRPS